MENTYTSSYIEKEDNHYASKGVAGTGLGLGIAGTALGLLNGGAGIFNQTNKNTMTTQDYVDITKNYYTQRISDLKEFTNTFYGLDTKIQAAKDAASAQAQSNFDELNKRIIDLEKSDAVLKATQPLYQEINDLKMNVINQNAINGIAGANATTASMVNLENERMKCRTNTLLNYSNSTFQPKTTVDPALGTSYTTLPIYNPFYNQYV